MMNGSDRTVNSVAIKLVILALSAFVVGGVGFGFAQGKLDTRMNTVEETQKTNQPIINSVDVMQGQVERIEDDVKEIRSDIRSVLDAVRKIE